MNDGDADHRHARLVEARGPWGFVTYRRYRRPDGTHHVWQSRHHRKRLVADGARAPLVHCLWLPGSLNWWIGLIFAVGSALFALGSVLTLAPNLAVQLGVPAAKVNVVFFAGSIPFTTAAYLQLYQAANVPGASHAVFGWRPHDVGWLSCALQFPGTVLFNFNTFDALVPGLDWLQQDLTVWVPDIAGSVLFLMSGYLAFIETCHAHFAWRPRSLSWWIVAFNLLGCIAFMVSAVFAFLPMHGPASEALTVSVVGTLAGAVGFLVGSLLMLPEALRGTAAG